MNINKYLIAAMLGAGLTATAQQNSSHSFRNQQETRVLEEGASSSADFQTKQMVAMLGLNADQAIKIKTINLNRATEIQRAKTECAGDPIGFNEYVDRVALARDKEIQSILTLEQFAYYSKNNGSTWLGLNKYKLNADNLTAGNNDNEPAIQGRSSVATEDISASSGIRGNVGEFSDAYSNRNNIISIPVAPTPDYHNIPKNDGETGEGKLLNMGVPDIKTYPGGIQNGKANVTQMEYAGRSNSIPGKEYSAKASVRKVGKGKVSSASAAGASSLNARKTSDLKPFANGSVGNFPGTNNSNENTFSSGQTLEPSPDSDDFLDVNASAKGSEPSNYGQNLERFNNTASENDKEEFFINEDPKVKINKDEIKIKSRVSDDKIKITKEEEKFKRGDSKVKITDEEYKSKDKEVKVKINANETKEKFPDGAKMKENDHESKYKDGQGGKIKSNSHETKIKKDDLKIKIKE